MKKLSLSGLFIFMLLLALSQEREFDHSNYLADYNKAEKLFKSAEQLNTRTDLDDKAQKRQDQLYNEALKIFSDVGQKIDHGKNDSLRFHTFIRIGLINHYFDHVAIARENYLAAIRLWPKISNIQDSFLFKPYMFLGGILYEDHQFDSAFFYYQLAESTQSNYGIALEGSERLYNKLGAMYYETGNYLLARSYFEKALSSLSPTQPSYTSLMINYKINIAAILVKLEEYNEAKRIYENLLPYRIYENEIRHNLGIINNHEGKFGEAIGNFKKIKYLTGSKNVDLDYNLAVAFNNLGQNDSANIYLEKASAENNKIYGNEKNIAWGLVLKFSGDRKAEKADYTGALHDFQQAMIQFDISFYEPDVYENPNQFTGIFSFINLFNALTAKAETFKKLYRVNRKIKDLEAGLDAYRSASKLVDYVEKTYESDESRLFLKQITYSKRGKPIDLCLELYDVTHEKKYLEEAYLFDQQNKASILSLNLQLHQMQKKGGILSDLLAKENSLKTSITRLTLNAAQITEGTELDKTNEAVNDLELRLASIQQVLNHNPKYLQLEPSDQIPGISALQHKLDDNTVLLSYHLAEKKIVIFVITKTGFHCSQQVIDSGFYTSLQLYLRYLHDVKGEEDESDKGVSRSLYRLLIKPVIPFAGARRRLIIIPDDELNYLPFEALKDDNNDFVIESFSVQYQYSTAILDIDSKTRNISQNENLAFAPFAGGKFQNTLETLPYSKDEVQNLSGRVFIGTEATKQNFILSANHYAIIHLATHARVNDSVPGKSFISFYPEVEDSAYRLYASEIYDLQLDSTELVILSACETGSGQLIRGEGLMSLSRAFAYAGCHNIITSLWKAEDKTTSFLTKRLHFYLQKNDSYEQALRKAKLDLLNSREIGPRFKLPSYWAHLIFIGDYNAEKLSFPWLWIVCAIAILIVVTGFLFLKKKSHTRWDSSFHRT